ncbi:MAG: protein arginine kinase [Chthoniobacterales bacterium]
MNLEAILSNAGEWLSGDGPHRQIVVSSRIRLARNLGNLPFPGWAKRAERQHVLGLIRPAVEALPEMTESYAQNLTELTALERQVLMERHLISREHAAKGAGSAVVMNVEQTLSFMINEEDHLRMQAIRCGLQLMSAYELASKADSELEGRLDYAFHDQLGYLTACPTNVGTGMRASAMLHLPGLVMSDQINKIVNSVNKIGLAVRGLHGEGSEAMGNLFQVSNQTTLGESEQEIIARLTKVIEHIIEHEGNARATLVERRPNTVLDQVGRAYGILSNAHSMNSKEALNLLSVIKLGIDLEMFPDTARIEIDRLFIETQPGHLQKGATEQKMSADARDSLRARLIRAKLHALPEPDLSPITEAAGDNQESNDE